jgi:glyoxylase-like metal-dependent hydrolase (beta-lactamase superfamily II)
LRRARSPCCLARAITDKGTAGLGAWWQRPFPDAHTLLLPCRQPAPVDTGFGGHADETAASARTYAGNVDLVVNTHWHSDHVGGNALLHAQGSAITADTPEADAITSRDPGRCAGRRCPTCTLGDLYLVRRSAGAAQGHS